MQSHRARVARLDGLVSGKEQYREQSPKDEADAPEKVQLLRKYVGPFAQKRP